MKYKREVETVTYTHEFLWRAGAYAIDHVNSNREGSHYFLTSAFLTSVLAFEAFINFVGEIVAADAWEDERSFFSRAPYRGIVGKVRKVFESLGLDLDEDSPAFAAFLNAKCLRDKIAHGRVVRTAESFFLDDRDSTQGYDFMQLAWEDVLEVRKIEEIRQHLKGLAETIRARAKESHVETDYHLLFTAFEGSLGSGSGCTSQIHDEQKG